MPVSANVFERVRIEGPRLIYKHEVAGPGGKQDTREVMFDISTA
jgi:hypothetical protein